MPERICSIDDCTTQARKRGWCSKHYQRWWKFGDPLRVRPPVPCCTVEGCSTPPRSTFATMCEMHYGRVRRNGHLDLLPRAERKPCAIQDCENLARSAGLCGKHAERRRKHGDPSVVLYRVGAGGSEHPCWRGDQITYSAAHMRTRAARGRASQYPCADCSRPAAQWSYNHTDPNALASDLGPYSTDPAHYRPRCVPCHKRFDLDRDTA